MLEPPFTPLVDCHHLVAPDFPGRWWLGLAKGEPHCDELEKRLAEEPVINVPSITLGGDANGAPHLRSRATCAGSMGTGSSRMASRFTCHKNPRGPF
jgi:hypothetical protein